MASIPPIDSRIDKRVPTQPNPYWFRSAADYTAKTHGAVTPGINANPNTATKLWQMAGIDIVQPSPQGVATGLPQMPWETGPAVQVQDQTYTFLTLDTAPNGRVRTMTVDDPEFGPMHGPTMGNDGSIRTFRELRAWFAPGASLGIPRLKRVTLPASVAGTLNLAGNPSMDYIGLPIEQNDEVMLIALPDGTVGAIQYQDFRNMFMTGQTPEQLRTSIVAIFQGSLPIREQFAAAQVFISQARF